MSETYAQRVRVTFSTDETVKYVGHLDMHRAWERAIRRAALPLAYSQGFNPQPRLHFAAALPVGFTGRAEVVDVFLNQVVDPADLLARLAAALPPGVRPSHAEPVPRELPALQAQTRGARYRVDVETGDDSTLFTARLERFMGSQAAWRARRRGPEQSTYDLRPLVSSASYAGPCDLGQAFEVTMRLEPGATGRPDELLAELGFETAPRRITRLELLFGAENGTRAP